MIRCAMMLPRTVPSEVFGWIDSKPQCEFTLSIEIVELYKESIQDLLDPSRQPKLKSSHSALAEKMKTETISNSRSRRATKSSSRNTGERMSK